MKQLQNKVSVLPEEQRQEALDKGVKEVKIAIQNKYDFLSKASDLILNSCNEIDAENVLKAIEKGSFSPVIACNVLSINWTLKLNEDVDFHFPSIQEAVYPKETIPSLAQMRLYKGLEFTHKFIFTSIVKFVSAYAVSRNSNGEQYRSTAKKIFKGYYFLKISELKFVFAEGLKNLKSFNGMDGTKIENLFSEYMKKRIFETDENSHYKHLGAVGINPEDIEKRRLKRRFGSGKSIKISDVERKKAKMYSVQITNEQKQEGKLLSRQIKSS